MFSLCKIFVLLLIISIRRIKTHSEEEYYVKLITKNSIESESYVLPKYYEEFQLKNIQQKPISIGNFDFIIIGGGTGGSLLTNRISDIPEWSVLLLEAGDEGDDYTDIPGVSAFLTNSKFNWGYNTTSQSQICQGNWKKICKYPRGKGLGGTSLINYNDYARGTALDYNHWAKSGLTGWSFKNILPYLKKIENATALKYIDVSYHGFSGDLILENYRNMSEIGHAYMNALKSFGFNFTDYNGKHPYGFGLDQQTTVNGKRNSGAKAFLDRIKERRNLKIMTKSLATKITVEGSRAKMVEFIHNNRKYFAKVDKEVLLSAGVIGSPQILMLSGIGPAEILKEINVTVHNNLPVGKNLRDHCYVELKANTNFSQSTTLEREVSQYLKGYGALTSAIRSNVLGLLNVGSHPTFEIKNLDGPHLEIINKTLSFAYPNEVGLLSFLLHAKSVGTVKLKSNNPLDFPIIDPNYLSEEEDYDNLITALNLTYSVYRSDVMKKYNVSTIPDEKYCGNFLLGTRDYWKCYLQYYGLPGLHGTGTCRMGINKTDSVVNERLIVHDMENIRVVDASSIPAPITGHVVATIYMVAEKGAHMIKEDYQVLC